MFHLSTGVLIYSALFWNALNILRPQPETYLNPNNYKNIMKFRNKAVLILPFIAFNILSGVTVAGIDAGKVKF
jgi:heme A synthase